MINDIVKKITFLTVSSTINTGRGIDEVAQRQQRWKMTVLREACERALWFTDSFNIDLLGIIFKTKTSNENITLNYNNPTSSSTITDSSLSSFDTSRPPILSLLNLRLNSVKFYIFWTSLPCLMSSIMNSQW